MLTEDQYYQWLEALESGTFTQIQGALHGCEGSTYCCLGVLSYILREYDEDGDLQYPVCIGLYEGMFIALNDEGAPDQYGRVIQYIQTHKQELCSDSGGSC